MTPAQPSFFEMAFPIIAMFAVFYIFMIRPQAKKQKEHQDFINSMKRGDKVITSSGIYGEVMGLTDKFVTLEVAENVRIKVLRSQVAGAVKEGNP